MVLGLLIHDVVVWFAGQKLTSTKGRRGRAFAVLFAHALFMYAGAALAKEGPDLVEKAWREIDAFVNAKPSGGDKPRRLMRQVPAPKQPPTRKPALKQPPARPSGANLAPASPR